MLECSCSAPVSDDVPHRDTAWPLSRVSLPVAVGLETSDSFRWPGSRQPRSVVIPPRNCSVIQVIEERAGDSAAIEKLLNGAFGPKRKRKISYRYRLRVPPVAGLSFVAEEDGVIAGTIRHWPILITSPDQTSCPALLLGPLAVSVNHRGNGLGARLIDRGLTQAREAGHELVILVGDLPYYARFGFSPASEYGISMPYEKPERVLALPLEARRAVPQGTIRHIDTRSEKATGLTAA